MAVTTAFYTSPDWQGSQVKLPVNVHSDDLYPTSLQGPAGKDALEDGMHPILAIGNDAVAEGRGIEQVCGVVVSYNLATLRAVLDVAPGKIVRQYVANILTYSGGDANTWETSMQIGMPVYVDDSDDLAIGVTCSLSPSNDAALANPIAGILFYDQTEQEDVGVGGGNADAWPKAVTGGATNYLLVNIMLRGAGA